MLSVLEAWTGDRRVHSIEFMVAVAFCRMM